MQGSSTPFATQVAGNDFVVEHFVSVTGISAYRTNACTCPNFEAGSTGWTPGGSVHPTLGTTSSNAFPGSNALLAAWGTGGTLPLVQGPAMATKVGQTYTYSAWLYVPTGSPSVGIVAAGFFGTATTVTNALQRVSVTFVATATTTNVQFWPATSPVSGQSVYISAVLYEEDDNLFDYFDGDYANAQWIGTADLSASQLMFYQDTSLAVDSIKVDRQITTDMPTGSRLLVGYPSASATIGMSGLVDPTREDRTISWLLNPDNSGSPLFRDDILDANIVVKCGLYVGGSPYAELITVFTGVITDYQCDAQGGVTIDCLDYRDKIRAVPQLPAFASAPTVSYANAPGLTPTYILEAVLRNSGFYVGPPPRANLLWFESFHGSMWPEVSGPNVFCTFGVTSGSFVTQPQWIPGLWGQQIVSPTSAGAVGLESQGSLNSSMTIPLSGSTNTALYTEWAQQIGLTTNGAFVKIAASLGHGPGSGLYANVTIGVSKTGATTTFILQFNGYTTGPALVGTITVTSTTVTSAWHAIGVQATFNPTTQAVTATFYVDGVSVGSGSIASALTSANIIAPFNVFDAVQIGTYEPIESLQITTETAAAPTNPATFVPNAVLDPSLNLGMVAPPNIAGNDGWGTIQQICDGELGFGGFDELGVFRFYNRVTLRTRAVSPVRSLSSASSLKSISSTMSNANIINHAQCPVNVLSIGTPQTVWTAPDIIHVPQRTTLSLIVTTDNPVINVPVNDSGFFHLTSGITPGTTVFRANDTPDGSGGSLGDNITIRTTQIGAQTLVLNITNGNVFDIWFVNGSDVGDGPAGQPTLIVGGQPVTSASGVGATATTTGAVVADVQWPPATEGGAASTPRGDRLYQFASNPFVQDLGTATELCTDVVIDQYQPRPLYTNVTIVADPRLQLADVTQLADTDALGINAPAMIFSSSLAVSATDWTQSLDLRSMTAPGGWILGLAGYSELGTDTYV